MNCLEHGGDVLSFQMLLHGQGFVEAAVALGAWDGDADGALFRERTRLPAGDLLNIAVDEARVVFVVACDMKAARAISEGDFERLVVACNRLEKISSL